MHQLKGFYKVAIFLSLLLLMKASIISLMVFLSFSSSSARALNCCSSSESRRVDLASNPLEINRLFNNIEDIPSFNNIDELSSFLKEYDQMENLKGFGKELQHLLKNEYRYDAFKNIFVK
jgi:hypothetical protein